MTARVGPDDLKVIAPAGYYLALRIGFAFPLEEINEFPTAWVEQYSKLGMMLSDPVIRWAYANTGYIQWSDLAASDPQGILKKAASHGMVYGVTVSVFDGNAEGQRSFGSFARSDREFNDLEIKLLTAFVTRRHAEMAPPTNMTNAELTALRMVRDGKRLKQIAFELGITEGAVKQRLKKAKEKLGAKTSTQAAAKASQVGLI